jgi:hypothetical protein
MDALGRIEAEVNDLLAEAARDRRYGDLPELTKIAEALTVLYAESASPSPSEGPRLSMSLSGPSASGIHTKDARPNYPVYFRDDDCLVKVGKSRASDDTYEHKAPFEVLEAVAKRAMAASKKNAKAFRPDALTNVTQHGDAVTVRGYQLYLCLGWLKRIGLLKQHGRKGCSINAVSTLAEDLKEHWQSLPSREAILEVDK